MRTVITASLRTHARRYLAVALAVLIATTFMVTTNALAGAANDGWRSSIAAEFEHADAVLTDVRPGRVDRVADLDGVASVATSDTGFWSVSTGSLDAVASVGTSPRAEGLRWQQVVDGRFPQRANEVLLSTDRAADAGVSIGDRLTVEDGTVSRDYTIVGTAEPTAGELGSSVYVTEQAMDRLRDHTPARVMVALDGDLDDAQVAALEDAAPQATVHDVDDYVHRLQLDATGDVDIMQKMLFVFASIALMVAALVIANTLAIVFAQRTRDFALLRCIGAKRVQITRSILIETAVVAVVSAALGVLVGLGIAYAGAGLLNAASPSIPIGTPSLTPLGVAIPTLVSIGVALAAALVPARRANRLSPLAALQPSVEPEGRTRPGVVRIGAAALFLLIGFGALAYASTSGSLPVGMLGGGVSFVGIVLMGPILVPGLIDAVRPLVAKLGGVPGRLAAANAVRHRRRTAATSAALLIGVTLISTVIVGTASMKSAAATEMDTRAPIDLVLGSDRPLPAPTASSVAEIDGVDAVAALDGTRIRLGHDRSQSVAVGVDERAAEVVRPGAALRDIADSQVYVPFELASEASLTDGDRVRVSGPNGTRRLEVVTGDEWGSAVAVSARTLRQLDDTTQVYSVWLRAEEGADVGTVVGELNTLADNVDGSVDGSLPQRAQIMSALDVVLAVTVGLLGVAVVIAIVGVGNTLSLSVLERVRENALLRALGLRRRQQRSMLAVEALLIASVAGAIGIVLGVAYAWFGVRTLAVEEFVTSPSVEIPVGQLTAVLVVAAVAGLLACVLPARRAAKIPPAAGLVAD